MLDLFYVAVSLSFFALAGWYVKGLRRLQPENDDE
jgi:hypothetical protein